jgi:hypothetical protein
VKYLQGINCLQVTIVRMTEIKNLGRAASGLVISQSKSRRTLTYMGKRNPAIPIIKRTRWNNFSNLFLEWNSTCFGQFLCPSSGVFHCTHRKLVWQIPLLCVQWKTPDDGQRNCPKHVEFYFKNKFEKLVHLVGFTIWSCLNVILSVCKCLLSFFALCSCTKI